MLAFGMALPFLPLYVQTLGVSDAQEAAGWSGLMSAGGMLMMAVLAPVWGALADRYGRKPMVTRAMFGGGIIVALMAFVHTPYQLLILRVLQGAFSGTVSATRTLIAGIVPAAELGFVLGMMQTSNYVGNSAGPLVGGVIADRFGFAPAFVLTGVLLVVGGVAVVRLVHEDFQRPAPVVGAHSGVRGGLADTVGLLLGVPGLMTMIITLFFVQMGVSTVSPILPLFVSSLLPPDDPNVATMSGLMLGAGALTGAVAAGIAGKLGDKWGHIRVVSVCAVLAGFLYFPQAYVTDAWQLVGLRAVLGIFSGGLLPGVMATIALRTPSGRRGVVFGVTATSTALGNAVGPAAGAAVANAAGFRSVFFLTAAVLTVAGIGIAYALRNVAEVAPDAPGEAATLAPPLIAASLQAEDAEAKTLRPV